MSDYKSEDYAAFLIFAGPPPADRPFRQSGLQYRLDYVGKCDEFCQEYFHGKAKEPGRPSLHVGEDWIEFYTAFTKWYRIRQEMSQDTDFEIDIITYQVCRDADL